MKSSISQLTFYCFKIIARETIHDRSYTRERMMSSVSPYSSKYPVGDSHNINNGMRAADGSGDKLGLQEKAPSRGMRYLVNITITFHVATRNTLSPTSTHTLCNMDAQRKEGTTRTHGSMAHVSVLGLVILVYCSMLQQMGAEAKARATEEDRVNTTTGMPGTYDVKKISIDDEKAMLVPTQVSRDIRGG